MRKIIPLLFVLPLMAFDAPKNSVAWDIVEGLTTEVGPRLPGSDDEARARDWAVIKLKSLGFKNVHIETYDMPVWVRGEETAEVVSPFKQKLILTALGNSAATTKDGLSATVIGFNSLEELKAAPDAMVKGKIVFVSHKMTATQDGSGYGAYGPARFIGPNIAAKKGAVGYLLRSLGTNNHRVAHTGVTRFEDGVSPIPSAALTVPDAENLERMLARAKTPVIIHMTLTPKQTGVHQSGNVVADVPGSDADAGMILIGGHLDSWDLGTGAIDDASGLAITTAAAKRILDGKQTKRTIRVVWWGSEEVGGFGSDAYYKAHKDDKVVAVAESDSGADKVWAFSYKLPEKSKAIGEKLVKDFNEAGIIYQTDNAHGGADIEHFVENGVAVFDLKQDATHYFDLHHTPDDTLDKIDPSALNQNVDAWEILLKNLSSTTEDIGLIPPKK